MISVVIGIYGEEAHWYGLAARAAASVPAHVETIISHAETLAKARNSGARKAHGDRLVFLDADDELGYGFAKKVVEPEDVLQPKTIYKQDGHYGPCIHLPAQPSLLYGNHIVVGAPVKRELFMDSGGFEEYGIAEDWALWLKLQSMGATFGKTEATYVVNVNLHGRNSRPDHGEIDRIRSRYL